MVHIDQKFIVDSVKTFGKDRQLILLLEECGELVQAVTKYIRNPTAARRDACVEELGDCYIMSKNLMHLLNISDEELQATIDYKTNRTKELIGGFRK